MLISIIMLSSTTIISLHQIGIGWSVVRWPTSTASISTRWTPCLISFRMLFIASCIISSFSRQLGCFLFVTLHSFLFINVFFVVPPFAAESCRIHHLRKLILVLVISCNHKVSKFDSTLIIDWSKFRHVNTFAPSIGTVVEMIFCLLGQSGLESLPVTIPRSGSPSKANSIVSSTPVFYPLV